MVVKSPAWVAGRASLGAIRIAASPDAAKQATSDLLRMPMIKSAVDTFVVEEKLAIQKKFYDAVIVNDCAQAPTMIFSHIGGI